MRKCNNCHRTTFDMANFCHHCGAKMTKPASKHIFEDAEEIVDEDFVELPLEVKEVPEIETDKPENNFDSLSQIEEESDDSTALTADEALTDFVEIIDEDNTERLEQESEDVPLFERESDVASDFQKTTS